MSDGWIILIFGIVGGSLLSWLIISVYNAGWKSRQENFDKLNERISDLEALCRFDNIPDLLINNPSFLKGNKPTEEQITWALKAIEEWRSKKESATPKNSAVLYPDSLPSKP